MAVTSAFLEKKRFSVPVDLLEILSQNALLTAQLQKADGSVRRGHELARSPEQRRLETPNEVSDSEIQRAAGQGSNDGSATRSKGTDLRGFDRQDRVEISEQALAAPPGRREAGIPQRQVRPGSVIDVTV